MKIHIFAASAIVAMTLAAGARAGEPTGVAACDDFFTKYEACIKDKAPPAQQAQAIAAMDPMRKTIRDLAADASTKPQADMICTQIMTSVKAQSATIGCSF
jgi:hypothetical protein